MSFTTAGNIGQIGLIDFRFYIIDTYSFWFDINADWQFFGRRRKKTF